MNQIKKIRIENVKGKKEFKCEFNSFDANHLNLLVAPNGFGKSTLATAFEALKGTKMELKKQDVYDKNGINKPSMEIGFVGENAGIYISDEVHNDIVKKMNIKVINSPIYAKGKSKNFGKFSTNEAVMSVEEIIIEKMIPQKVTIEEANMNILFPEVGKIFLKLKHIFQSIHNMEIIIELLGELKKLHSQTGTQKLIRTFYKTLNKLENNGTALHIRSKIKLYDTEEFDKNNRFYTVANRLTEMENLPCIPTDRIGVYLILLQLIETIELPYNDFKKTLKYLKYQELRKNIDENIKLFNTTDRTIKTQVKKNKLVVQFPPANEMSNGERDVITFIIQILTFGVNFNKNMGILVMDEIFDYLDGSNMLIAQFFLSKYIAKFKSLGKIFFPVVLTHLDPYLFNNYYLKNIKVHYLKEVANMSGKDMVNFMKIRSNKEKYPDLVNRIESGYIHFYNKVISLTDEEQGVIGNKKYFNTIEFKTMVIGEIDKYLKNKRYDPIKVICAVRIKVEEIAYNMLSENSDKCEFLSTHTTSKKLDFVENRVGCVDEKLYLLAPLYNDALHMDLKDNNRNLSKIKSVCLKLDNLVVKKILSEIFD
jgi:energy-coupling factor transporter ATP-binding protein EcfA2